MGVTAFTVILGPLCLIWCLNPVRLLQLMALASVFEAAAALTLGGVGLQPAVMPGLTFLGFIGLQFLLGARYAGQTQALAMTRPFLLVTLWALTSSYLMPRVFEGTVMVWPQKAEPPFVLTALAPTSSNMNQDFYLVVNCALLICCAIFFTKSGLQLATFIRMYLISGLVAGGVAVWQFANKMAHVPYPDALFYSNPGWSILTEQSIGSIPRINGPFSEPSSLGAYMGAIVCASGWQLLLGHRQKILRWIFVCGLLTMLMSTSTTGFGVLALCCAGVGVAALVTGSMKMMGSILKIGVPLLLVIGVIYAGASIFSPKFNDSIGQIISVSLNKQQSSSYDARTSTDVDSLMVALDTFGLGAGWGSNRSSSLVPGLLSGLGLPGCAGLVWLGVTITRRVRRARRGPCSRDHLFVIDGCCGAIVGYLTAGLLSGPTINSVVFFFLLALLIGCLVRVDLNNAPARAAARRAVVCPDGAAMPAMRG